MANSDDVFQRGVHGGYDRLASAKWADPDALHDRASHDGPLAYKAGRVFLGVTDNGAALPVGWDDDRHIVTIAGSRGGKGRSAIVPNLLLYPGPVVCVDPKGENAQLTAGWRARPTSEGGLGQDVYVFDPFNASGVSDTLKACFNPISALDPEDHDIVEQVGIIADSLVVVSDAKDAHWDESARALIEALILHVITSDHLASRRDLLTIRRLLLLGDNEAADNMADAGDAEEEAATACGITFPEELWIAGESSWSAEIREEEAGEDEAPDPFFAMLIAMTSNPAFPEAIGGPARALLDMGPEERGSVLSCARRNTKFLDGKPIHAVLGSGLRKFDFEKLKASPRGVSVYLCLPTRYLATHARWLRLMIAMMFGAVERYPGTPNCGHDILAIIDEFPVLGYMRSMETAAGYVAGYKLRLWSILQDISQLKRDYPKSWETFLGNAGLIQFFANSDNSTLEFLSNRLGETEIRRTLQTSSTSSGWSEQEISDDEKRMRNLDHTTRSRALDLQTDTRSRTQQSENSTSAIENVFRGPLITPQEIAYEFRRDGMLQGLLTASTNPFVLRRVNHDDKRYQRLWPGWQAS